VATPGSVRNLLEQEGIVMRHAAAWIGVFRRLHEARDLSAVLDIFHYVGRDRPRALKAKLKAGKAVIGAWLSLNDPVAAEILARVGFDFRRGARRMGPRDVANIIDGF
jgi:hypothetical protein